MDNEISFDTCVDNYSVTALKALAAPTSKRPPRDDRRPSIPACIPDQIARKSGWGGSGRSPGNPFWKPRLTACRGRWPAVLRSGETTSGALHSNSSILKNNRCGGWPSGWWEFLIHRPWSPQGESLSRIPRKPKPLQSVGSFSAGDLFGSYCDDCRGADVSILKPFQRTTVTHPTRFMKPLGVSRSARLRAWTVYQTRYWCIFTRMRLPSSPYLQCGSPHLSLPQTWNTLEWSLALNWGRIHHWPLPIGLWVVWTRLVNYLKRSY